MIPGATEEVPLLDQLVARWELSRLVAVPFSLSILAVWPLFLLVCAWQVLTGMKPAGPILLALAGWCVLAVFDVGRGSWTLRHPYASTRWLRAVRAAVGDDLAVRALACLIRQHDREPGYVVRRSDMIAAVQLEREELREAARRAEGFRLVEAPAPPDPKVLADIERVRRARERLAFRAAGQGRVTDVLEAAARSFGSGPHVGRNARSHGTPAGGAPIRCSVSPGGEA